MSVEMDDAGVPGPSGAPPEPTGRGAAAPPTVLIVLGMAGSGKTTLIQRINSYLHSRQRPGYIINLDPAVTHLPYGANIDIRDTVKYKNVMKQYNLGPNGGILTSCNLFATRFDQVLQLCEKPRDPPLQYVVVDTPGQIEIFTWSASGQIITELLASSFPTVCVYVADTPRCASPHTFISNMMQACSILYKTQLPLLVVFNKIDVVRPETARSWMDDFDAFDASLASERGYGASLARSLALALGPFYDGLKAVGVSAVTGEGMEEMFEAVASCREEYTAHYAAELQRRRHKRQQQEQHRQQGEMARLSRDMHGVSLQGGQAGSWEAAASVVGGGGGGSGSDVDYHVEDSEVEDDSDGAEQYHHAKAALGSANGSRKL